jgi:hypothetical protein
MYILFIKLDQVPRHSTFGHESLLFGHERHASEQKQMWCPYRSEARTQPVALHNQRDNVYILRDDKEQWRGKARKVLLV